MAHPELVEKGGEVGLEVSRDGIVASLEDEKPSVRRIGCRTLFGCGVFLEFVKHLIDQIDDQRYLLSVQYSIVCSRSPVMVKIHVLRRE